jgi:hypothetical protein
MSKLDDLPLKLPDSEESRKKIMLLEVRAAPQCVICAKLSSHLWLKANTCSDRLMFNKSHEL